MITIYKYIREQYKDISNGLFIKRAVQRTRGHTYSLEERRFHQQQRKGFFTVRAVKMWNSLPMETVMADTINLLKKRLDIFLERKGIQGYTK
ncbi:hypothetical protein FKM82_015575 [Ascaphus truei]